jgi:hypothetical protein
LFSLIFHIEDEGSRTLQNVGNDILEHTVSLASVFTVTSDLTHIFLYGKCEHQRELHKTLDLAEDTERRKEAEGK